MRKNVIRLTLCAMLLALSYSASAQQTKKIPRIGYLSSAGDSNNPGPNVEAFRQGLRDLGYIEGKNTLVEYRYLEGKVDRLPDFVADLVQLKLDVFVSPIDTAIRAAKQAMTIPIVMVITGDPVASGLVDSLARPGGNITGLTRLTRDLSGKRLELLKEAVPGITRVGVLWSGTNLSGSRRAPGIRDYEAAARELKIQLQSLEVRSPNNPDFEAAFRDAAKGHASALITIRATVLSRYPKRIADLAIKTDCLQCSNLVIM
jgi:putative ABC transport system substrate-binding protein